METATAMLESDSTLILTVMMVVAIMATVLYDLYTNVHARRGRRAAMERPDVERYAVAPEPRVIVCPLPMGAMGTAAVDLPVQSVTAELSRISIPEPVRPWGGRVIASVAPALDPHLEPMRMLAERLAALRLLGLDHVREAHPLFRAVSELQALRPRIGEIAGATPRRRPETDAAPSRRRRARRRAPDALVAARATGRLRLVTDADRRRP